MPVVAFCLKIIWLIVLTRLLFLPLLLGLGFALAASALERHITSNPADGCAALGVEPQHVVLGQTQSADGGAGFEATMRAVPVIAMQPDWEFGGTLIGIQIRAGIRPLA